MPNGGKRPGAGRKPGSVSKKTIEKRKAEESLHQRILGVVDRILNAQMTLAEGTSFLFRIDEIGAGKDKRREHVLVTDPEEIKQYLDGEFRGDQDEDGNDTYYYIQTKSPDNKAIDSMLDRVFGKATNKTDITSGGKPIPLMNFTTDAVRNNDGDKKGQRA